MKLYSSEIRWFSETKDELLQIFQNIPGSSSFVEERTDLYYLTETINLGIKKRGGAENLEVKWLAEQRSYFKIEGKKAGTIEHWIKSGFNCKDQNSEFAIKKGDWIKVYKKRYKKGFEINDKEVSPIKKYNGYTNCDLEFTEVIINNTIKNFTLGFESLGKPAISRVFLNKTLVYCIEYLNLKTLSKCKDGSYPYILKGYLG